MSFDPYRKWLGIPSNRRPPNYYELLGITSGEKDADVIRSAIDQRRMYISSKKGEGQDGHVKAILGLIEEATSTLLVPEFKHGYDRQLGLHLKTKGSRRSYVLPSWMESRVVRVYGEGSGIVGDVLGIVSILLVAFGLMAWWSFRLHDERETVLSDPAPIIEQKPSDEMENKAPANEAVKVPVAQVFVDLEPVEKTNSVQELELAAISISTPDAVRLLELEFGKPRLYDSSPLRIIEARKAELKGWQFTSIPQRINNSYEIIANKPTTIYAFGGGKKFTAADFFGTDAAKWETANGDITGINVNVCLKRELRSGETLRLSGFELQICAESMVLSKPLQPAPTMKAPIQSQLGNDEGLDGASAKAESKSLEENENLIGSTLFRGHKYKVFREAGLDWMTAKSRCAAMGGHLVTISDEQENKFMIALATKTIGDINNSGIWLGATDERNEGKWEWIDGTPFKYSNWNQGQPNGKGKENYLLLLLYFRGLQGKESRGWCDQPIAGKIHVIYYACEWDSIENLIKQ